MDYKVLITEDAENDLDRHIHYLLYVKKNEQAARNVLEDFEETVAVLSHAASSMKLCQNPRLNELCYRRINFQRHRYFMMYRIVGNTVQVDNIFHQLQDYEGRMI